MDLDDLLGFQKRDVTIDDLLGPTKRKRRSKPQKGSRKYEPLEEPRSPVPGGIFAARERMGSKLGDKCLVCGVELKIPHRGRPPVICRKKSCFRAYRNMYRKDYDKQRSAA